MFRCRMYPLLLTGLALVFAPAAGAEPPTGARIPQDGASSDDPLPEEAIGRLGTPRLRQIGGAACIAFAPNGTTCASADDTGIHVWDVKTGKELRQIPGATEVLAVAFSADGKIVIAADKDCVLHHWEIATAKSIRKTEQMYKIETFVDGNGKCKLVRGDYAIFPPGGKYCLISREGQSFWVFDATSCKRIGHIASPASWGIGSGALAPDGKAIALIGSAEGPGEGKTTITLCHAASGERIQAFEGGGEGAGSWTTFSPDGKMLLTVGTKSLGLWDVTTGEHHSILRQAHGPAVFSPDGKLLAFDDGGAICLWGLSTAEDVGRFDERPGRVRMLAFSPDGKRLASTQGHVIHLWETATGKPVHAFSGHQGEVTSLAFSPDDKTLASGGDEADSTLLLWDLATRQAVCRMNGHLHNVLTAAFSPDGRTITTGDGRRGTYAEDAFVRIWEAATGKLIRKFPAHQSGVYCLAYTPDGKHVASGGADERTCLWDANTGKKQRSFRGTQDQINCLAFSPDGKTLATAGSSNKLWLFSWDSSTGDGRGQLQGDHDCFTFVGFCQKGKILVTGERETFRRWEIESGREIGCFSKNHNQVRCQALSPDGLTLATGGWDHNVYLWDMARGTLLLSLKGHRGAVSSLAFSSDGKRLASGSADTTVLVWDLGALPRARLETLVADLMSTNKSDGDYAVMTLEAMPKVTVPLLKERLPKAVALEKRILSLAIDLDDNEYEVREKASRELEKLGWSAETTLRACLQNEMSAEAQRRIQEVLDLLSGTSSSPPPSEVLGAMRSLLILEHIDTPEARQVLETVAKGHPQAPLTKEARAALARLAKH